MKFIFLDIDGVLNTPASRSRCGVYTGIDDDKVKELKAIVTATDARIVLISTWKKRWQRRAKDKYKQDKCADYLDRKFKKQRLAVYDKTADVDDGYYLSRGESILWFISQNPCDGYVIIDDYQFDYDGCGLTDNLIKTDGTQGLTKTKAQGAIKILRGEKQ